MSSQDVNILIDMGFPRNKAERALEVTGNQGVEPAMEWLLAHSDETIPMSPTPLSDVSERMDSTTLSKGDDSNVETVSAETLDNKASVNESESAKSLKCDDCGKLFKTQLEVEFHASKSGHSSFSESTEEKKPLSEEEKKEQLRKLEEKMKQKRLEREEKEKQEALEREKMRIKSGKEMTAAKKKLEEDEMKKLIDLRKREKMEEKLARQRVKDQIEQDKIARKIKFGSGQSTETTVSQPTSPPPSAAIQKDYTQTKLQIRLTNGQALTQTFGSKEQLSAVRLYVEMNRTDGAGPFSLMTNFPKRVFLDDDYEKPLDLLGLVPNAVVIVSRAVH